MHTQTAGSKQVKFVSNWWDPYGWYLDEAKNTCKHTELYMKMQQMYKVQA